MEKEFENLSNEQIIALSRVKILNEINSLDLNSFVEFYSTQLRGKDRFLIKELRKVLDHFVYYTLLNECTGESCLTMYNSLSLVCDFLERLLENDTEANQYIFIEQKK